MLFCLKRWLQVVLVSYAHGEFSPISMAVCFVFSFSLRYAREQTSFGCPLMCRFIIAVFHDEYAAVIWDWHYSAVRLGLGRI